MNEREPVSDDQAHTPPNHQFKKNNSQSSIRQESGAMVKASRPVPGQVRFGKDQVNVCEGQKSRTSRRLDYSKSVSSTAAASPTATTVGRRHRASGAHTAASQSRNNPVHSGSKSESEDIVAEIVVRTGEEMDIETPDPPTPAEEVEP